MSRTTRGFIEAYVNSPIYENTLTPLIDAHTGLVATIPPGSFVGELMIRNIDSVEQLTPGVKFSIGTNKNSNQLISMLHTDIVNQATIHKQFADQTQNFIHDHNVLFITPHNGNIECGTLIIHVEFSITH